MKNIYFYIVLTGAIVFFIFLFSKTQKNNILYSTDSTLSTVKQYKEKISSEKPLVIEPSKNNDEEFKQQIQFLVKNFRNLNDKIIQLEKRLNQKLSSTADRYTKPKDIVKNLQIHPINYNDTFDSVLYSEETDNEWALQAQDEMENALSSLRQEIPEIVIIENACYSTLCKVTYELPNDDNIQHRINKISDELVWEAKSFSQYKISETGEVIVSGYYMRENHDYPESVLALRDMDNAQ